MERNEISVHEVRVVQALKTFKGWVTNKEIGQHIKGIAPRTVRAHTDKLVKLGLAEMAEVFPGHRYRWSAKGEKRNRAYLLRLERAEEALG